MNNEAPPTYWDWLKQIAYFKGGWPGLLVALVTVAATPFLVYWGFDFFPPGRYPRIVLALPGLAAGGGVFLISSALLWPFLGVGPADRNPNIPAKIKGKDGILAVVRVCTGMRVDDRSRLPILSLPRADPAEQPGARRERRKVDPAPAGLPGLLCPIRPHRGTHKGA